MIELRTLTLADALAVTTNMRQADRDCLRAVSVVEDPQTWAVTHWQTEGPAWTMVDGGVPVAIGGIKLPLPWVGVIWFVGTDRLRPASWKKLARHAHIVLPNAVRHLRRVEAHVLSTWPEAKQFAERMGLELEGIRYGAGRDGQDILTYVYQGQK